MKFFLHNWRNGLLALIVTRRAIWSLTQARSWRVGGSHHICQGVSHENMTLDVTLLWPGDNWLLSCIKNISRSRHEMGHSVTGCIIWNVTRNWHESRGGHGNVFKWLDCVRAQSIFWCCIIRFQYWRVRLCLGQRGIVRGGGSLINVYLVWRRLCSTAGGAGTQGNKSDWLVAVQWTVFWHRVITSLGFSPYNLVSAERMLRGVKREEKRVPRHTCQEAQ